MTEWISRSRRQQQRWALGRSPSEEEKRTNLLRGSTTGRFRRPQGPQVLNSIMQEGPQQCSNFHAVKVASLGCLVAAVLFLQPLQSDAAPRARMTHRHVETQHTGLGIWRSAAVAVQEGLRPLRSSWKARGASRGGASEEDVMNVEEVKGATVDDERHMPELHAHRGGRQAARVLDKEVEGEGRLRHAGEDSDSDDHLSEPGGHRIGSTTAKATTTAGTQCRGNPFLNDTWLLSEDSAPLGARACLSLRKVCMDQSSFILYDDQYQIVNRTWPTFPQLDRSDLMVRGPSRSVAPPSSHLGQSQRENARSGRLNYRKCTCTRFWWLL